MAEILDIDPDAVLGKVIRFWMWADQNTENGNLNVTTSGYINRITSCPGFADALVQVGWLRRGENCLVIPNFDYHMSESAKKRANNAKKVRKHRSLLPKCNHDGLHNVTEEGYKKVTPSSSTSSSTSDSLECKFINELPEKLNNEQFINAWKKWRKYCKDKGHCVQPMQEIETFTKLAEYRIEQAVEIVLGTIRGGWKGLVYDLAKKVEPDPHYPTGEEIMARALKEQKERDDAKRAAQERGTGANASQPGDAEPGGLRGSIRDSAA